jgi:hypothetical protein
MDGGQAALWAASRLTHAFNVWAAFLGHPLSAEAADQGEGGNGPTHGRNRAASAPATRRHAVGRPPRLACGTMHSCAKALASVFSRKAAAMRTISWA